MKPVRIAVVNSHPVQYSAPLYAYANRDPRLEITALYCSDYSMRGARDPGFGREVRWDIDLLAGYRAVFLGPRAATRSIDGFWSLVVPELWREIRSGRYDAVWLHGYGYAAYVLAFIAAKSRGLPVYMRSETHLALRRPRWKQRLRDAFLARAYRFIDRFLAIGTANHDYYRALGVPEDRIHLVPYTVDNDRFIPAARLEAAERVALREKFGLPPDGVPVVMFASKFMRRKHPECVLQAAALLRDRGLRVALLMVGAGEMEAQLRALTARLGLEDVAFPGFVNQSELPAVYAAADVFVLPSADEPWGFIVNEVMCAGLPVVVSEDVGCVPDLVRDGVNGRLIRAGDPESLALALQDVLADPAKRAEMGRQSLALISNWNYERCRVGLVEASRASQA
jgi:glycosyltransferase involved in cell wall biosynthesis